MKRIFILLIYCIMFLPLSYAEEHVLSAGVTVNDIPKNFFGSWRIVAKLEESNSYSTFKPQSADIWTLSRRGDIVTLSNPLTGASAQISLRAVEGNLIVFSKKAPYDNKLLTDTVTIRLDKNKFSGINSLALESYSLVDNHLMKVERARYKIEGEKISGENILE